MSAGTMVVGIRFQADTNDAIHGNQEITKSFRSISESLKDIASRAVASSNSMANGAKEAVKSNKQIGEELKKQSNVFKNLQQQASQSISATKARLTDFTQSVKQNFVQSVNSVGQFVFSLKNIASGISAIPSPMKQVISIGADFEYQMSAIGAVSSATDEEMAFLGKGMRELAATSAFSASQVGEAGANMARAGFSVKDTMASLPGVLALAAASGESLGTASQIAAEQLNAFKMETKEMSMVADLFAKAANASNVGVAELGESMKYSSPIFKAAGQSIQTVVAATSLLANVGIHGSQSGTTLRMAMLRLAGPPEAAAAALDQLGVEVSEVGGDVGEFAKTMEKSQQSLEKAGVQLKGEGGKFRDFGDILADLNKGMQGLGQAEKIEKLGDIFGAEAASGMLELVEQSKEFQKTIVENGKSVTITTTAFKEFRKEVSDNAGFAQKTSDIMLANLKGDWNAFTGNLEELALSIFDIVGPLLRPLVQLGTGWVQSIVAGVQSIVPVMAAFRVGFMSAIEPIKNALNSLGSAIAPTIEILKVTFAPLTGQLEGSGKAFDTFKSAAQTTGVVLANIVSIGLVPFVTAVKIVAPLVNMVSVGVANLTGGISKLVAQFSVATSGMSFFEKLQQGASMLLMMDWGSAGKALVTTFIAGITATGQEIYSAVLGIFSWVGNLFPHSDAKEGPFSNLTASGQSIISTLASGVIEGGKSLVSSISEIFSEVPPVIHLALVPGLALVTNLLTRNIPLLAPLRLLSDVVLRLAGGFMGFNMTYKKTATSVDEVVAKTSLLKRVLIGVGGALVLAMTNEPGRALITTFAEGVKSAGKVFFDAVSNVFGWVASLLPHSDAKEGPFSNLTESGRSIISTLASGVIEGGKNLVSSISEIFSEVPPVIHLALVPGLALVTNLLTRNIPLLSPLHALSDVVLRLAGGFMGFNMTYKKTATSVDEVVAKTSLLKRVLIGVGGALVLAMTNEPGRALITTFAEGVKSAGKVFFDAVSNVFSWVASLLPHSDADTGPFSNLFQSGVSLIQTFAKGAMSVGGWLVNSIKGLFANVSSTMIAATVGGLAVMATKGMKMPTSASAVMGVASKAASWTAVVAGGVVKLTKTIFGMFTGISQLITGLSTFANLLVSVSRLLLNFVLSFSSLGKTIAILTPIIYLVRSFKTEFMAIAESVFQLDFQGVVDNTLILFANMKESWIANWRRMGEEYKDSFIGKIISSTNTIIEYLTNAWESSVDYLQSIWVQLFPGHQQMAKNFGILSAATVGFLSLFKGSTVANFLGNMTNAISSLLPALRGSLLLLSGIGKLAIFSVLYPEEIKTSAIFIVDAVKSAWGTVKDVVHYMQAIFDKANIKMLAWSLTIQSAFLYLLPFPPLLKSVIISIGGFDLLLKKGAGIATNYKELKIAIASVISGITVAVMGMNPFLAMLGSVISTVIVFREEIKTSLTSAKDYWLGFWSSLSKTTKLIITGIAAIGATVALFATGIVSLPVVVIGAVSGVIAGLGAYREKFLNFFSSITETWQMAILGFGAVAVAALAISMKRIFGFLSDQKNAAAKAKACITSPLMACTVVDDEEAEKNLKKRFLAAKRKGLDTLDTGDKKDCTGLFGGCEKDITQQSQLLSNSATAAGNANKAAADTSRRSWLSFGGSVWSFLKAGWFGLGRTVNAVWAHSVNLFRTGWTNTWSFIKAGTFGLGRALNATWAHSINLFDRMATRMTTVFTSLPSAINTAMTKVSATSSLVANKIVSFSNSSVSALGQIKTKYLELSKAAGAYMEKAKWVGSGVSLERNQDGSINKHQGAVISRAMEMAQREGASRFVEGDSGKETERFKQLKEEAVKQADEVKNFFQKLSSSLSSTWSTIKAGWSGTGRTLNAVWAHSVNLFRTGWTNTWSFIQTGWTSKVVPQLTKVSNYAGRMWDGAVTKSGPFFDKMWQSVTNLSTRMSSAFQNMGAAVSPMWNQVKTTGLGVFNQLRNAGSNIASTWQWARGEMWTTFKAASLSTWQSIKVASQSTFSTLRLAGITAWTHIKVASQMAMQTSISVLRTTGASLWTTFKVAGVQAWTAIKITALNSQTQIKLAGSNIANIWQRANAIIWPAFQTAGVATWGILKTTGLSSLAAFRSAGTLVWTVFKEVGLLTFAPIKTAGVFAFNQIKMAGVSILSFWQSAAGTIWPTFKAAGILTWNTIKATGMASWSAFQLAGASIWATTKSASVSAWASVKTASGTIWPQFQAIGTAVWNPIKVAGLNAFAQLKMASSHISSTWQWARGEMWATFKAAGLSTLTSIKLASASVWATMGGPVITRGIGQAFTAASAHSARFWTGFKAFSTPAISASTGFIGRAFTVASSHTANFWARFTTQGEVATTASQSRLSGMFSKKTAMIGAITAGTVATTMFSSQDAAASELGNTPKVDVEGTQSQLKSAFSLTSIKEKWSQDLLEMLDKFGLLKPIGDAITYTLENMETVGMGAMLVLSTGLLDLGMAFTVVKTGAAALGAFFIGWQIGTFLYNQFTVVQETAITVVGAFVEMGRGIASGIGVAIDAIANFRFADFADSILTSIKNIPAGLGQLTTSLNETWHGLGDVLMAPANLLSDLTQIIGTTIGEVTGAIASGNWGEAGLSIITGIVKGLWAVASNVSSAILGIAKMAISAILPESWYQAGAKLLGAFGEGIVSFGKSIYDSVLGVFKYVWNLFPHSDANEGPFAQLTSSGQGLITAFVNGVLSLPSLILDAITGIFTGVSNYLESLVYSERGVSIITSIKIGILSVPTLILDTITGIFTGVYTYLKGLVYSDRGIAILTSIKDGILSAPSILIDSVKQVFDSVMNYISTIDFTEAGRKLLGTVGNGIKQGAKELTTAVSDGLTSVRQYLPFSDAKVGPLSDLTASGQSIPSTLATGVAQNSETLTAAVADMTQQGSGAMGALETAAASTATSVKATATEATQSLAEAEERLRIAKEKLFELSQKKSLTTSRSEKKQITQEEVGVRQEVHDAQAAVRQLRESTKEQTAIQKAAAKEAEKAAKEANKAIKESAKEAARDMKESLNDQADALTNVSKQYKEAAKATEEFADKLKRTYETLSYTRNELSMSSMNDMQKGIFQNVNDYGADYGQQLAQVKMLTSANQELTAAKNELAKAGMSESQARLFDLQQKYTENVALEIYQTQELAKTKKALYEESQKSRESQLVGDQKEYVDLMKQVGVEEGKRIILQRQALSNQAKLKQESDSYWDSMSEKAGEYYENFATGQMSAKQSLKGFFSSVLEEQKKAALEKSKQAFLGLFGLGKDKGQQDSQVQRDLDKAAKFMKESNDGVVNAGKDMAGTIAKSVEEAGKNLSTSVDNLGKQVNETLQKATELTAKSDDLEKAANQLKETASDISITRAGNEALTSQNEVGKAGENLSQALDKTGDGVTKTTGEIVSANQKYVKVTNEVASALEGASKQFKFSLLELSRMASLESSFNAKASNGQYKGLFQFGKDASADTGLKNAFDPKQIAEAAIKYWEINKGYLNKSSPGWQQTSSKLGIQEGLLAWMAQNQGAGGLGEILKTLTTGVNKLSADVTTNLRKNLVGGEGKNLSGVELAQKYMEGWIGKWNKLPLPEQFKEQFQSAVGQGVVTVAAKASEEAGKSVAKGLGEVAKPTAAGNTSGLGGGVAINDSTLDVLSDTTNKYIQKGVSYELGAKNIELGKIDCSGWVNLLTKTAFEKINQQAGQVVFDKSDMKLLQDSSHNIIQNIVDKTGVLIDSRKTDNFGSQLKEGMMIGLDKGDHGWDRGRVRAGSDIDKNIDHIVQVTVDKVTGKLGISESHSIKQGGKQVGGVMWTELDKWLEQNKKATMFAVDPFKLAAKDMQTTLGNVTKASQTATEASEEMQAALNETTEASQTASKAIKEVVQADNENASKAEKVATVKSNVAKASVDQTAEAILRDATLKVNTSLKGQVKSTGNLDMSGDKAFVIHHTATMGSAKGVVDILKQRGLGVQYVIDRDGTVVQLLDSNLKASHVGKTELKKNITNANAVGVEIVGGYDNAITPAQMASALKLAKSLGFNKEEVMGHGELTSRKRYTEGMSATEYAKANWDKVGKIDVKAINEPLQNTGKALSQVAKVASEAVTLQTQANQDQSQAVQLRLKNEQEATNMTAALAEAKKTEQAALSELTSAATQQKQTELVSAQSYEQAMQAVQAMRMSTAGTDVAALSQHAQATETANLAIQDSTGQAVQEVAKVASEVGTEMANAAGQCLAEVAENPAIQNAADLKEATEVMTENCQGKSDGIMGMFSGLTDKIGGFFSGIGGKLGDLFGGGGDGGFLSKITGGISSLFGGGGKEGGGFLSSITSGLGSLFGGGGKEGKEGGIMSTIGSLFSGKGDVMGTLTKGLGGLMGGTEEAGKFISGLTSNLGNLTGSMGEVGKGISSLLGGGSTPGMSALSAATSLLSGDMAGAAQGAAQLLGSMTPLGPIGGMIAGKLVSLAGIGAKWVREAEWVEVSMKGMTASFSKGYRETKKGLIGGGSRTKHEDLDEATVKKLSDMLGETKKSIEAVSDSLSMGKDGLLGKMDNFRYHIAAMENKGPEWFDKAFEKMRVAMVKSAVDNIMIAGEDVKTNLGGNFKNTFKQVLDGTFNEAARAETWDGVLTKFVASADTAIKGGLQDNVSTQLGERLTEFVNSSADQFKNMPIDQLQGALTGEIGKIFTDITGVAIPESISGELAEVFATRIQDAVKLASGEEVSGATVITDKGEAAFYKTLKGMVGSFEGTEQELTTFISKMMEVKDVFKQTGLDMSVVSEDLIKGFGDIEKFSSSMAFFKDNFASASGTNIEFTNSLSGLNKSLKEIQGDALPGINTAFPTTREEFYKLTQSVAKLGKDGEETFAALIKGAPQFANYYKAIEDFNQKFGGASGTTLKAQAKKATDLNKTLNDSFKGLGIELPKTRKGLYDLVKGFDLTNKSQRKLHDKILELAPAFDELFTNNEQVDKFRESMRGVYDSAGGAEKTISDLSKQFPDLNLGASAMTLNTKEAARSLANMSDGELMAWAESMGLTGLSIEDITQKTTDYLTAATELQTNIGSFKEEMHKIATGATDNEAALSKLVDKYPMLSDSLTQAGVTATEVASYFDQMSPDQLKALADSLGVTVDTLMADTQTYIGILQSQSDMFKSINGESLGGDLMKVMTDANITSANEAGKMFADNFVSQFESQMVSTVLNSVMQTIYQGVVEPFLTSSAQAAMNITEGGAIAGTNMVQGSTSAATTSATGGQMAATAMATGGMLAGDALAKIVEDAKQKIMVMGQVMSELKSSGVFDQITSSLSSVGETAYNTFSTAAPTLFEPAKQKQADDAAKQAEEASKAEEKADKAEEKAAEKQAREEEREAKKQAREEEAESKRAAKEAEKQAIKNIKDFNKSMELMSLGLEGNAKAQYELSQVYSNTSAAQLFNASSSEELMTSLKSLGLKELQGIASATEQDLSKVTGDFLGLLDAMRQSEKAMGDFRNKMAITAGTTTEYGQTITRLRNEYPELTSVFNDQGLSSKELATQLSTMDDSQIKSIAASLGVTTDQFMADSEAYIGALKSQEEALRSQQESLKSFRDSLEEIANPNQGKQKTIGDLDKEFAGLGLAAKAMTLDTAAAAKAMLSMPDDQLIAFAEQYGLTTDQLKEKTVAYFGAVNELQQGMDTWRDKMSQMVSGESEATTTVKNLSQKSPYLADMTQGMDSKAMAKLFSGLDNTQIEALANQYGVSIEKFEADTEAWVNSTKTIEEETKNLAQGFVEFRTKMGQIASGTTDAQVSLSKLSNTYGGFSEVQGKSSKELATYFSTLSDADIGSLATRFGVTTDQFKTDAETLVSSTQSIEEVTKSQAESMKEFRDSLSLMAGTMTENELSIKNLSDKYPSLSGILNDSSISAKDAAERFNSLSDDELRNLATSLGTDFDTLKADAGTWLGILKQQDDGLKESTKAIGDFQNEMRKTAGAANDSQITMEGLTAKYPALATAINDSSISAKDAATQFASMDMQSLADQLGIPVEELITDSQAWVGAIAANDEAIKANQEAMAGYRDTMLKATGTYGDSDIALRNLTASYPTLASTLNSTSLSAKDAATYFGQLGDTEFEELAKSLDVTTDKLRTDSTEWVNMIAANQESFNSFHETMVKLKAGVTDNDLTLQKLASQYPSLSSQILKSGLTAEQAASQFANLSEADLEAMAASLGVTTDKLKEDIQAFANALPSGQVFKDLRTGLAELINPLQGAEKTIDDLAKKYPDLNLATNALGLNVTEAATAIQGMTDNDMTTWAEANKIAPEEAKEATLAYLGAVKELQGQIGSFKDKMHQMATGMTDNEATIERLKKQYPSLSDSLSKTGVTAQDVAKQFDSMSSQQIADMAKSLGVSVETFMADVEAYTGVLTAQAEETKAKAEQLSSFRTEMTKLGSTLSESELTLNNLTSKFPSLVDSLKGLGTNSKDVANQLASLDDAKLEELAKASKVTTDQFLENATTYINTLASQEAETKAAIESVQGMQDGFKKLTSGMKDSEYTINQLGSKYPNLISSMGLSGKTAEEVASQFATMDPARVVEMAKSLGVSTDEFVGDIGGYVSALQSMAEEAKAITDSLNGFRGEMDRMASSMTDYDYTLSNLSKTVPNLTNKLGGLGSTSQAIAGSLSRMNADQLEAMAKQAGLSVDEFINNSKSYIDAMKSREASIEEEQKKAQEEAQKQADEAAEKAKQEAEKVQADLMKQVDKFFDVFGKLADKLGAVSESIASDIQSFDTQEENATAARRNAQMQALQKSLNDFKGIDLAKEVDKDSAKESEKAVANIEKYRKLLMEESKFRIDAVTKEKDEVLKTHDEIIAGFTKLKESVAGIMNSIADDITALDAELGKGDKKTALKEKTSGEFANAIATFQSSMAKDAGQRTEIGKAAGIDTTQLQGVSASALQQSSQSLLAISEANIAILKQGQENSKQAIADGEKLVKLGEEYRKGINDALREQLADLDKANEEVSKQLEKTQEETIKRLETERDEKIKAAEKSRDDTIKALETERDTKIKHLEEIQEAAKKLQETLTKVKDAVASLQDAVKSDMEKLAKDMSLPGTTAIEKLNAMQGSISSNMPVTEESVKKLETYKGLILESLQEQIDLENQRFEKQQEAEAKQLDHYKKLVDFSKQLKGFLDDLKLGELTTYNPTERLAEARRQYEETLRLAKSGDEEAMGQVTAKAQGYLKEAQGYYASSDEYTDIFKDVNSNISDLKGVAEAEADKIARELPLDKTETAKNVANILPLQQAALDKLTGVDGLLASMGADVATQLTSPAATPMPDDQFSAMLEKEKENFTNLIETQKTDTDKLIENTKVDTDKLIESTKADTEKAIADNKATTEAEGNKLRELAKAELQSLNTSLGGIESQLKTASEATFDDTDFANNVTALQQASVGQLVQLGNYVIAMDAGLKDSLKTNIDGLMSQLSPENQLIVAERLDEAMQRNITGPLYELIGAVKGESVKKELAKKESGFKDNQTAIDNALLAFGQFRNITQKYNISASFDDFVSELGKYVSYSKNANGDELINRDAVGIEKMIKEKFGATIEASGVNQNWDLVSLINQIVVKRDGKNELEWSKFKNGYLQTNKELLTAFQSQQGTKQAEDLAKYSELSMIVSDLDKSLTFFKSTTVNQGRTDSEVYNSMDKRPQKLMAEANGVQVQIDTYDDFKNAKATLEELRKSLIGVTSLKGELDGLNSKLVTTKTELPKLSLSASLGGSQATKELPSLMSYLPTTASQSTVAGSTTIKGVTDKTGVAGISAMGASPNLNITGGVSGSGAKDIIVKLDSLSTKWLDLTQGYRKEDIKSYEKQVKEDVERWTGWRKEELVWRTEDLTTELKWREEDIAYRVVKDEQHIAELLAEETTDAARHLELIGAIRSIPSQQNESPAPSFDVGTPYVEKDMRADVHEGEIIIDPASADFVRKYGIRVQATPAKEGSGDNTEVVSLLNILIQEIRTLNASNSRVNSGVQQAIINLENTVGAPLVSAIKRAGQPTTIRK